jgi:hypothetical protein
MSAQIHALQAAGATAIFKEKISGVRADRPQLGKLMAALKAGDIVVVTKLDRLGRSTRELSGSALSQSDAAGSFRIEFIVGLRFSAVCNRVNGTYKIVKTN